MQHKLALVLLLLAAACQFPEKAAPAMAVTAPSEAEARKYAEEFIAALSKPNVARASMMIDWDILLDRATANSGGSQRFREGFIKGAKENAQLSSYAQQMAKMVSDGAQISLLRIRGDEKERRALLRVLLPNGGVTYNDLLLTRDEKGFVRAADVYAYATGEYFSAGMRRMYLAALAAEPTAMQRLAGKENTSVEAIKMYKEMSEKTMTGRNQEAVELFKRMPPELRKEKIVLVGYVSAAASLDEKQYEEAIEELRKTYPDDAGIDLMLIDGFYLKKRYAEALAAIDRLDASLGGDPYLDALRANMLVEKGDVDAAFKYAWRGAEREPRLPALQWSLVSISLARRNFEETARLLTHLRDDLHVEIGDLTASPVYAEFVQSPAYERWSR